MKKIARETSVNGVKVAKSKTASASKQPWGITKEEYGKALLATELRSLSDKKTPWYRKYKRATRDSMISRKDTLGGAPLARTEWRKKIAALKEKAQKEIDELFGAGAFYSLTASHEDQVKQALKEGKPVPAEVLAEYPDLKIVKPAREQLARRGAKKGTAQVKTEGQLQTEYVKRGYFVAIKPGARYWITDKEKPLRGILKIYSKAALTDIDGTIKQFEKVSEAEMKGETPEGWVKSKRHR